MAPKKPSAKELAAELVNTTNMIYKFDDPTLLSVNYVREQVEERLELDAGFFKEGTWKEKSKQIIKDAVVRIQCYPQSHRARLTTAFQAKLDIDDENTAPSPAVTKSVTSTTSPKGRKRASQDDAEQTPTPSKRQRTKTAKSAEAAETPVKTRVRKPKTTPKKKEESELSEPEEESEEEKPAGKKRKVQKKPSPNKSAAAKKNEPPPKRGGRKSSKVVAPDSDEEEDQEEAELGSELSEIDETPKKRTPKKASAKKPEPKPEPETEPAALSSDSPLTDIKDGDSEVQTDNKTPAVVDETDSEESIVFDEPPKPKRKRKGKDAAEKPPAKSRAKAAKSVAQLSADDEEIKKLQGYLGKCGVRKIWPIVLKQYGDDSRAKIRHLKEMLKEVGMDGRFSEAKAREIKERRELEAELEAVQEMNEQWGKDGGGRASRSRAARPKKPLKDDSDDEDENGDGEKEEASKDDSGDDDDDEEGPLQKRARALAKRRADFAFLGDEEESD
jgi:hypothetical protein